MEADRNARIVSAPISSRKCIDSRKAKIALVYIYITSASKLITISAVLIIIWIVFVFLAGSILFFLPQRPAVVHHVTFTSPYSRPSVIPREMHNYSFRLHSVREILQKRFTQAVLSKEVQSLYGSTLFSL